MRPWTRALIVRQTLYKMGLIDGNIVPEVRVLEVIQKMCEMHDGPGSLLDAFAAAVKERSCDAE